MKRFLTIWVLSAVIAIAVGIVTFNIASQHYQPNLSGTSSTKTIQPPKAEEIENRINAYRSEKGLPLFKDSSTLDLAAMARAEGMCAANDWSHNKDWEVLNQYYAYSYAGENLYYGYLQEEQARVSVQNWIASPTHLANIVAEYTEIGVAVKYCPGFQNEPNAVIITNYFGVPR